MSDIVVDVAWPIRHTGWIPLEHGYYLLSAVSLVAPFVHVDRHVGIHRIRGMPSSPGRLALTRASALTIRARSGSIRDMLPLSGKRLVLGGRPITLGVPSLRLMRRCPALYSHIVTVKGFQEPGPFADALRRQLGAIGVRSPVEIDIGQRRVVRVKGNTIVGFRVQLASLTEEESVSVQAEGLGGRRHLGCGLFLPVPPAAQAE